MASANYGSKGDSVKEMQKKLNELGAGLNIDGVWGKATENAYAKFISGGTGAFGNINFEYMKPVVKTDDEIRDYAKGQTDKIFDLQAENAKIEKDYNVELLENATAKLGPEYEERLKALSDSYEKQREQLGDYALKRGMGRSSYSLDVQNNNVMEQSGKEVSLNADKAEKVREMDRQIDYLKVQFVSFENMLSEQKQTEFMKIIKELENDRSTTVNEALKYNNDLRYKEQQFQLDFEKYKEQIKQAAAKSAYSSSSKGYSSYSKSSYSKSKSSGSSKSSASSNALKKLSSAGKKAYLNKNKNSLAVKNPGSLNSIGKAVNKVY